MPLHLRQGEERHEEERRGPGRILEEVTSRMGSEYKGRGVAKSEKGSRWCEDAVHT